MSLAENLAANPRDDLSRYVGDFHRSCIDEDRIEAVGLTPLQQYLDDIDRATCFEELAVLWGKWIRDGIVRPIDVLPVRMCTGKDVL